MSSAVNNVSNNSYLQGLSFDQTSSTEEDDKESSNKLGQSAFLELMITQLNNQNPLDPQDNSEFVAQLAQFSSVEGLERLNTSMDGLVNSYQSSQALQASALVGRTVRVETDSVPLTEDGIISGTIDLEDSTTNLLLNIYNSSGSLVQQISLGQQAEGELEFAWDGTNANGEASPPGMYTFQALAQSGDEVVTVGTSLSVNVNSVTLGANGAMTLNLNGVGTASMSDVRAIL